MLSKINSDTAMRNILVIFVITLRVMIKWILGFLVRHNFYLPVILSVCFASFVCLLIKVFFFQTCVFSSHKNKWWLNIFFYIGQGFLIGDKIKVALDTEVIKHDFILIFFLSFKIILIKYTKKYSNFKLCNNSTKTRILKLKLFSEIKF